MSSPPLAAPPPPPRAANQPTKQPAKQPTNQPAKQPNNQPSSQPTKQPANQPTNQPTNQSANQATNQIHSHRVMSVQRLRMLFSLYYTWGKKAIKLLNWNMVFWNVLCSTVFTAWGLRLLLNNKAAHKNQRLLFFSASQRLFFCSYPLVFLRNK